MNQRMNCICDKTIFNSSCVNIGFTSLLLAIHKHQTTSAKILIDELGIRAVSAIIDTGINSAHVAATAGYLIKMM